MDTTVILLLATIAVLLCIMGYLLFLNLRKTNKPKLFAKKTVNVKTEEKEEEKEEEKKQKEKPKDIFCNSDFEKCFSIYKEVCTKLIPIRFERRSKAILEQLSLFLDEIEYNFDYFKELCIKANELEKIAENKIDFKMMLNNHIGITNDKYKKPKVEIKWDY